MASIDSDEVVEEAAGEALPDLGEEPVEVPSLYGAAGVLEAPDEPSDLPEARPFTAPARRATQVPADLTDELEEADFFAQQGLLADARDALLHLRAYHAGHPVLEARLADVDRRLAAKAAPPPAPARPSGPAAATAPARTRSAASVPEAPRPSTSRAPGGRARR